MTARSNIAAVDGAADSLPATRRSRAKRWAVGAIIALAALAVTGWGLFNWFVALQNRNVTSGVRVGQRAPDFALRDQNGGVRSLHDLAGPKGLLLVFVRSADW
jgi:hypothetical protein